MINTYVCLKTLHIIQSELASTDVEMTLHLYEDGVLSVPMARGKHLFPFRTQQLSLAAVTILGVHPWENSTVPNYIKPFRIGGALSLSEYIDCITLL